MALYKGFIPNWVRLGPWNIIVSFQYFGSVVYLYLLPVVFMFEVLELSKWKILGQWCLSLGHLMPVSTPF